MGAKFTDIRRHIHISLCQYTLHLVLSHQIFAIKQVPPHHLSHITTESNRPGNKSHPCTILCYDSEPAITAIYNNDGLADSYWHRGARRNIESGLLLGNIIIIMMGNCSSRWLICSDGLKGIGLCTNIAKFFPLLILNAAPKRTGESHTLATYHKM